jgi:pimeloyl-ACP methyl ester carboxylesterase
MKNVMSIPIIFILSLFITGCQKESLTLSGIAEDHFFLRSGNQHMPITVGGNVDSKKFMVIIHGGPGGTSIVYRDNYVKDVIEKEFAMVYWDQRFAGNTQGNGGNTHISEFRRDIRNLLLLLRNKYGEDNDYYLFAHSWGGFLAPYFLADGNNQDLVKGWIQVGGAHNYHMNDSLTREMLLHYGRIELAKGNHIEDWEEIVDWCNENGFEGRENAITLNGFAHLAETLIDNVHASDFEFDFAFLRQNAIMAQFTNLYSSAFRKIDEPTYSTPNSDQLYKITLPTLLLWGKYDFVCPPGLALDIEENIGSDDVSKIIYQHSGHSPMDNQYELFWNDVVSWIKSH